MAKTISSLKLLVLAVAGLVSASVAQERPELKIQAVESGWSFQIKSFDLSEVWMLQFSLDGSDWRDLIFLTGERGFLGYRVKVPPGGLPAEAGETVLFRAKEMKVANPDYRDYLAARMRWRAAGITDYSYQVRSGQGLVESTVRYTVVDGEVTSAEVLEIQPPFFEPPTQVTIDDWFDRVSRAIADGAFKIDVTWNEETGAPDRGFLDLEEFLADEEVRWTIESFEPAG